MNDDVDVIDAIDLETIPLGDELETERVPMDPARVHAHLRRGAWVLVAAFLAFTLLAPTIGATTTKVPRPRVQRDPRPAVLPHGRAQLQATSFVDGRHGFAIEEVLQVTRMHVGLVPELTDTYFVSTGDGGRTWTGVGPHVPYAVGVAFVDARRGVLATLDRGLRYTTDGGVHWTQTGEVIDAVVATRDALWARQDQRILRSADGGRTWRVTNENASDHSTLLAPDEHDIYVATYSSSDVRINATSDGGATWSDRASPCTNVDFVTLSAAPNGVLWAACSTIADVPRSTNNYYSVDMSFYRSTDGSRSWSRRRRRSMRAPFVTQVLAVSATEAITSNGFELSRTTDAGASWHPVTSHLDETDSRMLEGAEIWSTVSLQW